MNTPLSESLGGPPSEPQRQRKTGPRRKYIKRRDETSFSRKWGVHVYDLAIEENVSEDALHMRTMKWGTPFRRKSKPTPFEAQYGFTPHELALILGLHPLTIERWLSRGENPAAHADPSVLVMTAPQRARAAINPDISIHNQQKYLKVLNGDKNFWLSPRHPAYDRARAGNLTPKDIKEIQAHG